MGRSFLCNSFSKLTRFWFSTFGQSKKTPKSDTEVHEQTILQALESAPSAGIFPRVQQCWRSMSAVTYRNGRRLGRNTAVHNVSSKQIHKRRCWTIWCTTLNKTLDSLANSVAIGELFFTKICRNVLFFDPMNLVIIEPSFLPAL